MYGDNIKEGGRTRNTCLIRLHSALERTKPHTLPVALRDLIDSRQAAGAGGVTIAQDISLQFP